MSDTPRLVDPPPRPRLAVVVGQPVTAWRNSAGDLVPVAPRAAPAADLAPVASGPLMPVPPYDERLMPSAELRTPFRPRWWSAWLAHVRGHARTHALVFAAFGLAGALLALGGVAP